MGECKKLFKTRFDIEASDQDCEVIRRVCVAVSTRAARLAAAGIVALVKKIKKTDGCTVAVDGSLYKRDPFPERYTSFVYYYVMLESIV
jgi:hexokinase